MQNRFKSPVLWISLISLGFLIAKCILNQQMPPEDVVITLVLSALGAAGIVNNPTNKTGV